MSKAHAMVDIETLDTQPTAVIASVAIIIFSLEDGATAASSWNVNLKQQIEAGRTISASTLQWWFDRDKAVQESTFLAPTKHPATVAFELDALLGKDVLLWGNGATFDNVLIRNFCESMGQPLELKYWNDRCFRTLAATFDPKKKLQPHSCAKHDAMADCQNQVEWFRNIAHEHDLRGLL